MKLSYGLVSVIQGVLTATVLDLSKHGSALQIVLCGNGWMLHSVA
jgi:hypothetical protein